MPLYSKQSQQLLVDLINASNPSLPVALTTTNAKYGAPAVITPQAGTIQNTSIKVTAKASSQYIGNTTLSYRRLDFGSLLRSIPVRIDKYSPTGTNFSPYKISDLIAVINSKYGLNIQPSDYVDGSLPAGNTNAVPAIGLAAGTRNSSITVAAAAGSYGYVGSFTLYWVQAPQDLATMILTPNLENARVYPGGLSVLDPAGTSTPYVVDLDAYNFDWTDLFQTLGILNASGVYANNYLGTYANGVQPTANAYGAAWAGMVQQLLVNNPSAPYTAYTQTDPGNVKGSLYGATATIVDLTTLANQQTYPEANFKYFNRCYVIDVPAAKAWAAGRLYLHFNG